MWGTSPTNHVGRSLQATYCKQLSPELEEHESHFPTLDVGHPSEWGVGGVQPDWTSPLLGDLGSTASHGVRCMT